MSANTSQWGMLKDALRDSIESLDGYRVTHAVFTTYAFEPEFFETSILPLLLPDGGQGLSLHSAVRRLQMETLLRQSPIAIDVYFDSRVVIPGCPLLPYAMVPVKMKDASFHGKIILLRLKKNGSKNVSGEVKWLLGTGSANLTKAGWWENIESWYFAPAFDPEDSPAGLLQGVKALFDFLPIQANGASSVMSREFDGTGSPISQAGEPVFGVFAPRVSGFIEWLGKQKQTKGSGKDRLEVISPYFPDAGHAALANELLKATGTKALNVWLPIDPWQAGGPAALIEEDCYEYLTKVNNLKWCGFIDTDLSMSRSVLAKTPRFLHAKVIRSPGNFCFMGSVNFSNKAFKSNFEAGFLFPDKSGNWLTQLSDRPVRFLKPVEQAAHHEGVDDTKPQLYASFDWKALKLSIDFFDAKDRRNSNVTKVSILDAQGSSIGKPISLPGAIVIKFDDPLYRDLQTNPWIKVIFNEGVTVAWVQQQALDYRPPPVDLRPDVWRILDMWRSLAQGGGGSEPGVFEPLEILLNRRGEGGDDLPEGEPELDVFAKMAEVHGSFYLLRNRLLEEMESNNTARLDYYFSAPRPDSLATLVARMEQPSEDQNEVDAIAAWVIFQWVIQICIDHGKNMPKAKDLGSRAKTLLDKLHKTEPLSKLESKWLEWAGRMFLCQPGKEHTVAGHFRNREEQ